MEYFKDKKILVTGGTGSLGVEIIKKLLKCSPEVIRIYSRDETKQFHLQQEFRGERKLRFLLGDIRDPKRLKHAMDGINIVFHVAALKHVVACEYNPFEALKTNIIGTANVVDAAIDAGVERVVFTSTDKATNPCNTMGVSKLFAERLVCSSQYYAGGAKTKLCTVRFGNVLGSRGSFVPLLIDQVKKGGPVTLTHPDMTRFFMSIDESLDLVFKSLKIVQGGEVFILKMPVIKISDLVDAVIEDIAPKSGYKPEDIKIEHIGVKPGEKMYEELLTSEEVERALEIDDMYVLTPTVKELNMVEYKYEGAKKITKTEYSSENEAVLTKLEITEMLKKAKLL